jgi:hypothetical protein
MDKSAELAITIIGGMIAIVCVIALFGWAWTRFPFVSAILAIIFFLFLLGVGLYITIKESED